MTKISVIMGAFNCEDTLGEALDSLMNQTFQDFSVVICNDGSKDKTQSILQKYKKIYPHKFILLSNEKNMGLNYTLNKCLGYAESEYIARMDADDISLPYRFERQVEFLDSNPDFVFVSSNMIHFDFSGDWGISRTKVIPTKIDLIKNSPFPHAPVMVRKYAYEKVNGYSEGKFYLRVEDYHLWIKFFSEGYKGFNIQEPLYKMRDDKEAYNRRTFKNRINGTYMRYQALKTLDIPLKYSFYVLRPILVWMLPTRIYELLHKKKIENRI